MTSIRVSVDKIDADIAQAEAEASAISKKIDVLHRELEEASQKTKRLRDLRSLMSTYAIGEDGGESAPSSEFQELTASDAIEKLFELFPTRTFKLDELFSELQARGWPGAQNAMQVAASRLTRAGVLDRPRTAHYRLTASTAGETGADDLPAAARENEEKP